MTNVEVTVKLIRAPLRHSLLIFCLLIGCLLSLVSCTLNPENNQDPSPPKTPEEELKSFEVEDGLKVQLVAAEPLVQDPVVIAFDEDGRLWVVEMRGFMPDIDGVGEKYPVGRVSVLQDTDGDGQMDTGKIYIDSLLMPRAIALVDGGALIVENMALWLTQDLDGDLQADTKIMIDPDYAGNAFPEHSGNGLWRGVDNWYYNAKSRFRYKLTEGSWQRDSTEFRGQWGISHDDEGRLIYNYNWSQLHADLVPPNYLSRNRNHLPTTGIDHGLTIDRRIYPIRPNPAVNRGYIPGTLDKEGRLLEFTSACSPFFYRGTALPQSYYANVFVCEPSGNLIKRNVVEESGLLLNAHDPHPGKEFFASTDERCRPVYLAAGPDGALYVADMYRGLIQHGAYVTPYLREQTLTRKLVQPVNHGRIWRIVPENWVTPQMAKLSDASSDELVGYLSHPNGWHRDVAQRLLVERGDKGVLPLLENLAVKGDQNHGRFHALWTLEGLKLINPDLLFKLLPDQSILIRNTALRLLEPIVKADKGIRAKLEVELVRSLDLAPVKHLLQVALTAGMLDQEGALQLLTRIAERTDSLALMRDAVLSSLQDREFTFLLSLQGSSQWQTHSPSREIFVEMLTNSIVRKGNPLELKSLLTMLENNPFRWQERAILTAMAIQGGNGKLKPVKLATSPGIFGSGTNLPRSQLDALALMFEWPGHKVEAGAHNKSQLNEGEQRQFALGRQHYLGTCATCHGTDGAGLARFAPPLIGSEWVVGDEKRLALILLHGIEGPMEVSGKMYDVPEILPVMPSHSTMDDATITSIMIYIRNEWGNHVGPVGRRTVGRTRHTTQGRVLPWTANELNQHMLDTKEPKEK